jgi:outer membrane protein assembly factor BamB
LETQIEERDEMQRSRLLSSICVLGAICGSLSAADPPAWATYRGNAQRTGNTDGRPGPDQPAVLWVLKSKDHVVAAPVPVKDGVCIAGFSGFNQPQVALYPLASTTAPPPVWSKIRPPLRLLSVSSPAVAGEALVFGEGMHVDATGVLTCLQAATGRLLWQLVLASDEKNPVHIEGAPTIAGGKVFVGGGGAGVFCVELEKALLDGKEYDFAAVARMQDQRWQELVAKYEEAKAKKDEFALPPSEDQLLKFTPKKLWQKGAGQWHVDAPVNLAGDTLLVPSAYLDKEKIGERALYAVHAATGDTIWKRELTYNPWGGATVAGELALVPGSSVGYYYKELKGAKGDVTALDLKTGAVKWRKEIPTGGVLGCVAVADGLAVCTATDGKVRAFKLTDGERAWLYDAKTPFFAPPAVAAGVAYVADLAGTIHALDLKTGAVKWTLPLAKQGGAPGMVYGGVTVHGGKLVVATCNIDGPFLGKDTVVVCIGQK